MTKQASRKARKCGLCGRRGHYALECTSDALENVLRDKARAFVNGGAHCERCNAPVELLGPYCIGCAIDRQIERLLGK